MQQVYLMRAGESHYKVGIAVNVRGRLITLQSFNPEKIELVTAKLIADAYNIEQSLHERLKKMKAPGANEWFTLTPEQAIEMAITIHKLPDVDISEKYILSKIVAQQTSMQKQINRKLDYVIDTYQRIKTAPVEQDLIDPTPANVPSERVQYVRPLKPLLTAEEKLRQDKQEALEVFKSAGKASTSLLQRKLRIGYGRAARIVESLEADGAISHEDGNRARKIIS